MVSSFADFLKDTLTDNVKGLLKPANWLVSAIFVVLNLVFVFPTLLDENVLSPTNIFIANPSLQLVSSVVLVLLIAYALSSAKTNIFLFIAGNLQLLPSQSSAQEQASLTKADIDKAIEAIKLPKNDDESLKLMITKPASLPGNAQNVNAQGQTSAAPATPSANAKSQGNASSLALLQTRRIKFPHIGFHRKTAQQEQENGTIASSKKPLSSTRSTLSVPEHKKHILLNETEYGIRQEIEQQWGVNWDSLNRHFEDAIGTEAEWNRVNNEQEALDFFISLTFILVLFASEDILVQFFWREGLSILWGWVFLGIAYLTYRLAVSKMRAWGQALGHAITMHRETLRQEFGLRSFENVDDEKALWQAVSQWIYSKGKNIPDNILPRQLISTPSNKNVKVDIYPDTVDTQHLEWKIETNGSTKYIQRVYQEINYLILVSNIEDENNKSEIKDIYISIFDSQVPIFFSEPVVEIQNSGAAQNQCINNKCSCMIISAESYNMYFPTKIIPIKPTYKPRQLLLHIPALELNRSIRLKYHLPSRLSRITVSDTSLELSPGGDSANQQQYYSNEVNITNKDDDNKNIKIELFHNQRDSDFKFIKAGNNGEEESLKLNQVAPYRYLYETAIEKDKPLMLKLDKRH